jgi:hypothetical protein
MCDIGLGAITCDFLRDGTHTEGRVHGDAAAQAVGREAKGNRGRFGEE